MANRYYLQRELRKEHEKLNCLYQKAIKKDTSLYTNELIQKNKKVSDLILKQKENDRLDDEKILYNRFNEQNVGYI